MHRQHVQRSIKRLIQLGIILEGVKIGISRSYRLNPSFGWKGSAKGHREALHEHLKVIKIRGRRAHGAALATLATCAHLSPDNQARLHRAGSVPCKPKTPKNLKMSAYGTLSPTARPPRVLPTPWALPTPAFATWQGGAGENLLHPYHIALSPPTCKGQAASGCFASLDRFPAPSASIVLLLSRRWRGVKGGEAVHFTLDALEPTQHFATGSGGWVLTACPCGAASEVGAWAKPQGVDTRKAFNVL